MLQIKITSFRTDISGSVWLNP